MGLGHLDFDFDGWFSVFGLEVNHKIYPISTFFRWILFYFAKQLMPRTKQDPWEYTIVEKVLTFSLVFVSYLFTVDSLSLGVALHFRRLCICLVCLSFHMHVDVCTALSCVGLRSDVILCCRVL